MKDKKYGILWVAHDFPPVKTSGIYRPVKIYKYLRKEEFKIDFLTQSEFRAKHDHDFDLLTELYPEPRIYRLPNLVLDELFGCLLSFVDSHCRSSMDGHEDKETVSAATCVDNLTALKRLYRLFMGLVYFPDEFFIWGVMAALKAVQLHMINRYDMVYSTSSPQSGHLAGIAMKLCGAKWVVDYRDGGVLWHKSILGYPKHKTRERVDHFYQRYVLKNADHVIVHSESLKKVFCGVFGIEPAKIVAISNGYDEGDFNGSKPDQQPRLKADREMHILHLGTWYLNPMEIAILIQALNALQSNLGRKNYKLFVHAVGDDLFSEAQKANIIGFGYYYHGVVPHREVGRYLLQADGYFLSTVIPTQAGGVLPGKLWEYLRGGKPILLFGPKDEAWETIHEAGVGFYVGQTGLDCTDLDRLLLRLTNKRRIPTPRQYSWEHRARSIEEVFRRVLLEER